MDPVDALTELGGIASLGELLALTGRRRLRTAVAVEHIVMVRRDCYTLPAADGARLTAARIGGTVSHLSAAQHWQWKVKFPPELPTVTVPRRRSGLDGCEAEVHWANLLPKDVDDGVTARVRTVVDCARTYDFGVGLSVADSALRAGVPADEILTAARASPRTGRPRAIRVAETADSRSANPFESVLRAIALEVPGLHVVPQQWVGNVGRVDLLDRDLGLVIEAESFEFHADRDSLARDVRRYTAMTRLGYVVVRFTWAEVMFRPDYVRAVLVDLVALRH